MALKWNPFTGTFDIVTGNAPTTTDVAEKIADIFGCPVTASVGDVVVPSTTIQDQVDPITSNVFANLGFGVIIEKLTLTTCKVLISGKLEGAANGVSGLTFGKVVFIGTNGLLTTTKPNTGHLQKMGMAIKSDAVFLLPSLEKVVLS